MSPYDVHQAAQRLKASGGGHSTAVANGAGNGTLFESTSISSAGHLSALAIVQASGTATDTQRLQLDAVVEYTPDGGTTWTAVDGVPAISETFDLGDGEFVTTVSAPVRLLGLPTSTLRVAVTPTFETSNTDTVSVSVVWVLAAPERS